MSKPPLPSNSHCRVCNVLLAAWADVGFYDSLICYKCEGKIVEEHAKKEKELEDMKTIAKLAGERCRNEPGPCWCTMHQGTYFD